VVRARTATAVAGLLASLAVSALLWWYFDTLLVFLLVPFVPFLFRSRDDVRECPVCGFRTREETHEYCPRDGHRLE
jgi:hypothetical protein